jgi:hypothetical protein
VITAPDGRRWRVTAVRPQDVLGERRRGADRRVTPVESLLDPPVLQRRTGDDRRVFVERRHALPGVLLPQAWHDGWLLFEAVGAPADAPEVRRRAPIPDGWTTLPDAALALELSRASRPSRPRG